MLAPSPSHAFRVAAIAWMLAACSSSTGTGAADATMLDAPPANQCTAYGQGYVCQSGACGAGYVDKEDYFCGSTGDLCCGPVGEGGLDASDDANVFVDGAVFETGPTDAAHDGSPDAAHHDAGLRDAGHDAGMHDAAMSLHDAMSDAEHHDAREDSREDAREDAKPDARHDAKHD